MWCGTLLFVALVASCRAAPRNVSVSTRLENVTANLRGTLDDLEEVLLREESHRVSLVNTASAAHVLDERFLSLSIDQTLLTELPWADPLILNMARQLSPAWFKITFDQNNFKASDMSFHQWAAVNHFVSAAGLTQMWDASSFTRSARTWRHQGSSVDLNSVEDVPRIFTFPPPARRMGFCASYESEEDLLWIRNNFPSYNNSELTVVGPETRFLGGVEQLDRFSKWLGQNVQNISAVSWNPTAIFPRRGEDSKAQLCTSQSDLIKLEESIVRGLVEKSADTRKPIWIGDLSLERDQPRNPLFGTFSGALLWFDRVAASAAAGVNVVFQPNLLPLHDRGRREEPRPEFWTAVLFKRLASPHVLQTRTSCEGNKPCRMYAHCTPAEPGSEYNPGAVTVMAVNMKDAKLFLNLSSLGSTCHQNPVEVDQYVLSGGPQLNSKEIYLNGQLLKVEEITGNLPYLSPIVLTSPSEIILPAYSIVFWVFKNLGAKACLTKSTRSKRECPETSQLAFVCSLTDFLGEHSTGRGFSRSTRCAFKPSSNQSFPFPPRKNIPQKRYNANLHTVECPPGSHHYDKDKCQLNGLSIINLLQQLIDTVKLRRIGCCSCNRDASASEPPSPTSIPSWPVVEEKPWLHDIGDYVTDSHASASQTPLEYTRFSLLPENYNTLRNRVTPATYIFNESRPPNGGNKGMNSILHSLEAKNIDDDPEKHFPFASTMPAYTETNTMSSRTYVQPQTPYTSAGNFQALDLITKHDKGTDRGHDLSNILRDSQKDLTLHEKERMSTVNMHDRDNINLQYIFDTKYNVTKPTKRPEAEPEYTLFHKNTAPVYAPTYITYSPISDVETSNGVLHHKKDDNEVFTRTTNPGPIQNEVILTKMYDGTITEQSRYGSEFPDYRNGIQHKGTIKQNLESSSSSAGSFRENGGKYVTAEKVFLPTLPATTPPTDLIQNFFTTLRDRVNHIWNQQREDNYTESYTEKVYTIPSYKFDGRPAQTTLVTVGPTSHRYGESYLEKVHTIPAFVSKPRTHFTNWKGQYNPKTHTDGTPGYNIEHPGKVHPYDTTPRSYQTQPWTNERFNPMIHDQSTTTNISPKAHSGTADGTYVDTNLSNYEGISNNPIDASHTTPLSLDSGMKENHKYPEIKYQIDQVPHYKSDSEGDSKSFIGEPYPNAIENETYPNKPQYPKQGVLLSIEECILQCASKDYYDDTNNIFLFISSLLAQLEPNNGRNQIDGYHNDREHHSHNRRSEYGAKTQCDLQSEYRELAKLLYEQMKERRSGDETQYVMCPVECMYSPSPEQFNQKLKLLRSLLTWLRDCFAER